VALCLVPVHFFRLCMRVHACSTSGSMGRLGRRCIQASSWDAEHRRGEEMEEQEEEEEEEEEEEDRKLLKAWGRTGGICRSMTVATAGRRRRELRRGKGGMRAACEVSATGEGRWWERSPSPFPLRAFPYS
jgi:hypothetical protein